MDASYDGRQVVGIDLHRRRSVIVRMTEDGRKLETVRITNSPAALRREIARAGEHPRVVLEATYGWYWAADVLEEAGAEVHLAHPLGVKAFTYRRVKNDERDAADLADLLRLGRLPEAWIAPPEIRELRELTRYRHKLVRLRTSCRDQVHVVLARLGIAVTHSDIFGVHGQGWLDGLHLPQPYAGKVASLRQLNGELTGEITLPGAGHRRPAGRARGIPGDPGAAGHRPGAGRGDRRGDRRHPPLPRSRAAVQLGRADAPPPRVRHQGEPRARDQAGLADTALGSVRGDPAAARRHAAAAGQGCHHRPPRHPGQEHRQGRRRPRAAHPGLLRHARRAHPPRRPSGTGRMTWTGPAAGREAAQRTAPCRAPATASPAARAPA
jgi:hypothetical protein